MSDELMPVSKNGRTAMDVALEAARAAGSILRDKFHSEHEVHFKGRSDIVTDVDLAAEKTIIELLNGEFPEFSILAEESKPVDGDSPYKWVVDPLDGTDNYSRGQPQFCVSVVHTVGTKPDVAAIFDPIRDELFTVVRDGEVLLNGRPIAVTDCDDPSSCAVAWAQRGVDPDDERRFNAALAEAARVFHRVRLTGSAALETAWVAAGRYDGALFSNVKWWDHAGVGLLVQEAGGRVTDVRGEPTGPESRRCVFSNGRIHDAILGIAATHRLELPFTKAPG